MYPYEATASWNYVITKDTPDIKADGYRYGGSGVYGVNPTTGEVVYKHGD